LIIWHLSGAIIFRLIEFYIHTDGLEINPVVTVQSFACNLGLYEKYAVYFLNNKSVGTSIGKGM
jgi:hypothetical protein